MSEFCSLLRNFELLDCTVQFSSCGLDIVLDIIQYRPLLNDQITKISKEVSKLRD